jgi:acetyltransferase-like isoleucine patch superfamily enzyme
MKYIKYIFSLFYAKFKFFSAHSLGKRCTLGFPARIFSSRSIRIGNNVNIGPHSWINCKINETSSRKTSLQIGDNSYIGRFCQINAWESVTIEEDVLIGDFVLISDCDHNFDNPEIPIIYQGDKFKGKVHIKSGAWLGRNAIIMPGVIIGHNAVVGANSVVTKNVLDNTVVGGVPARLLK